MNTKIRKRIAVPPACGEEPGRRPASEREEVLRTVKAHQPKSWRLASRVSRPWRIWRQCLHRWIAGIYGERRSQRLTRAKNRQVIGAWALWSLIAGLGHWGLRPSAEPDFDSPAGGFCLSRRIPRLVAICCGALRVSTPKGKIATVCNSLLAVVLWVTP